MADVKRDAKRGPQPRTTRAEIVATAVAIVDRDGAAALTMRRLAEACGLSPMGVYRYVRDREELLDGVVEHVLDSIPRRRLRGTWPRKARQLFGGFRATCLRHPGVVALGVSRVTPVPGMVRFTNDALSVMAEAGLRGDAAVLAYDALLMFTVGSVLWQVPRDGGERSQLLETAARMRVPAVELERHAAALVRRDPDHYFAAGLDLVLAGIASAARDNTGGAGAGRRPVGG